MLSFERFESASQAPMTHAPDLVALLVCPQCRGSLDSVSLPEATRRTLVERYREHFRDEQPVVEIGLRCAACERVYPIVSDIPVMLVDEALPATVLAR